MRFSFDCETRQPASTINHGHPQSTQTKWSSLGRAGLGCIHPMSNTSSSVSSSWTRQRFVLLLLPFEKGGRRREGRVFATTEDTWNPLTTHQDVRTLFRVFLFLISLSCTSHSVHEPWCLWEGMRGLRGGRHLENKSEMKILKFMYCSSKKPVCQSLLTARHLRDGV